VTREIVLGQGLLDVLEAEVVERKEPVGLFEWVRRVGVDRQRRVGKRLPDRSHRLDVVAGLDLELDAPIALVDEALDQLEEIVEVRLHPQADPAWDAVADAPEMIGERHAHLAEGEIGHRHLVRRLGHAMTAYPGRPPRERGGDQEVAENRPCASGPLIGVARPFHRRALAPALRAVRSDRTDQHAFLLGRRAE
jgi:hypothetical protein